MSFRTRLLVALLPVCFVSAGAIVAHGSPCALPSLFIGNAWAADSCTNWMKQPNKCQWRTCVDGKGRQYCQEACPGKQITKVSCR